MADSPQMDMLPGGLGWLRQCLERQPTRLVDRETGQIETERRSDGWLLQLIYGESVGSRLLRMVVRQPIVSKLITWKDSQPATLDELLLFAQRAGIDLAEAEHPLQHYTTINELFTRRLKPNARPVETDPKRLLAPADSALLVLPRLNGQNITVKGGEYTVAQLLVDDRLAEQFHEGAAAVFRLAPADYHRFHFPDSGTVGQPRRISGYLDSVAPVALERHPQVHCRNKRDLLLLRSDHFGPIALLAIGACTVGTIVQTYGPGRIKRGQEAGYFSLGGSAIVMLLQRDRVVFDDDLVRHSHQGLETKVKMGTGIGRSPS